MEISSDYDLKFSTFEVSAINARDYKILIKDSDCSYANADTHSI